MTTLIIVAMYMITIVSLCALVGIVFKVGDLGFWCFGKIDQYFQDRYFAKVRIVPVRVKE